MLYYIKKGKNIMETQRKICAVYGEDAVTDPMYQKWFGKFCARDWVDQLKLIVMKLRH